MHTIVIYHSPDESIAFQHRECLQSLAFTHKVRALHVLLPGQQVIHLAPKPIIGNLPISSHTQKGLQSSRNYKKARGDVLVYGQHDRQHGGQVGSRLQKDASFMESLANEFVLLVIEFEDRLLKIADTAVN